ncbi:putative ubiquinone biosynthesis protein UbiB [Stieleria neptunia]|uniref:Putative ubiquinone biosynthesis protein UbiB n=1 Tax=Stieleria neptunia TaxID=2527979 RepID=A0A518HKT2_9BACT|nr:AarF/UbiB family protein [Stieleria neptunia]QDV41448.1 putative ubiquinone biosynthesis protein UbiB [Stieleria neptunia]
MIPRWEFLLDEASFRSILPPEHAQFSRPIREGLSLFLGGLPPEQQIAIVRAQAQLPPSASFSQRLGVLARSSPVLHKVGQILARDKRLPLELRGYLSELESLPPVVSQPVLEQAITQELGPLDRLGITLGPAIAEASVAVVVPFDCDRPLDGTTTTAGVFKILKPGIEQQLDHELRLLTQVGEQLDRRCEALQIPELDYEDAFSQTHVKLLDEVQLENEQRHLVEAKAFFADEPRVQIPELLEHCTKRVTAMERLSGGKVTDHGLFGGREKRELAALIGEALIAAPVFSKRDAPIFHGDPHAGNLFLTDDGRLGILDWSLVGRLGTDVRRMIVQISLAAVTLDARGVALRMAELAGPQTPDETALKAVAEKWVACVRRGRFPGLSWLVAMLDEAVQQARLRVPEDLMLLRKSLLALEGVVMDVGDRTGLIDRTLNMEFMRHFAVELPQRWFHPPFSNRFATQLSNFDITQALLGAPTALASFLTGHALDAIESCQGKASNTMNVSH